MYLLGYSELEERRAARQDQSLQSWIDLDSAEATRLSAGSSSRVNPRYNPRYASRKNRSVSPSLEPKQPPIEDVVRDLIAEIRGDSSSSYYSRFYTKDKLSYLDELHIGKAMALAEQDYGRFDRIALNVSGEILGDFPPSTSPKFSFSSPHTAGGSFDWEYLRDRVLPSYFAADADFSYSLDYRDSIGLIRLELKLEHSMLKWNLRGMSRLRKRARSLAEELNRALTDYYERLKHMAHYKVSIPKPGLTVAQLEIVSKALSVFESKRFELNSLRPGVSFGDDPIIFGSESRVYFSRCRDCGFPVNGESVKWFHSGQNPRWESSGVSTSEIIGSYLNKPLVKFHREFGCLGSYYTSSRTGEDYLIFE